MTAEGNNGYKWNATKEVIGSLGGDIGGTIVGLGAFTYMDDVAPEATKYISKIVGKICIEPFLDTIEKGMQKWKSKDYQPDFSKPREERAASYAHYLTRFGISAGLAWTTEILLRKTLNSSMNVKNPTRPFTASLIDRSLETGLIVFANTLASKQTDLAIDATSNFTQEAFGMKKNRADKFADGAMRYQVEKLAASLLTSAYVFSRQIWSKH